MVVQELGWDEDADQELRESVEDAIDGRSRLIRMKGAVELQS